MNKLVCVLAVAGLAAAAGARPTNVFSSDFESGTPAGWGGYYSVESSQGLSAWGFGNNLSRNDSAPAQATTLTLSNLPAHDSVSVQFLLAIIDSWDGNGGNPGPDSFEVKVDGNTVFSAVFASASGSSDYAGAPFAVGNFGWNSWNDYLYDFTNVASLNNIAHTASSLTVEFTAAGPGWQGGSDESFGVDNVNVMVNEVPAPGAMAIAGAASLVLTRRRR